MFLFVNFYAREEYSCEPYERETSKDDSKINSRRSTINQFESNGANHFVRKVLILIDNDRITKS